MNCCGKERDTAFCPDCGKKLVKDSLLPLHGLLVHMRKMAMDYRLRAKKLDDLMAEHGNNKIGKWPAMLKRHLATAEKWEQWEKALREVMGLETDGKS